MASTKGSSKATFASSKQPSKTPNYVPVPISNFDPDRLIFDPISSSGASSTETKWNVFPKYRYDDNLPPSKIVLTTGPIRLERGGIPKFGTKYHEEVNKCNYLSLYLPEDTPEGLEIIEKLEEVDKRIDEAFELDPDDPKNSSNNYIVRFRENDPAYDRSKVIYYPMVKTVEPSAAAKDRTPYKQLKLNFATVYKKEKDRDPNKPHELNMKVKINTSGDVSKPSWDFIDVKTTDDLRNYIKWKSVIQCGFEISLIGIEKVPSVDVPDPFKKGKFIKKHSARAKLKLLFIAVLEVPEYTGGSGGNILDLDGDGYDLFAPHISTTSETSLEEKNDDEEVKPQKVVSRPAAKKKPVKESSEDEDSESDDESESDEDSEEEEKSQSKKKAPTKKAPAKKASSKKKEESDSETESDSDSESDDD